MHGCLVLNRSFTQFCLSQTTLLSIGKARGGESCWGGCCDLQYIHNPRTEFPTLRPRVMFVCYKQHFYMLGNREVQRLLGWLLCFFICTQSAHEQSPTPFFCINIFLAQTTHLFGWKHRGAEGRGFLV